MTSYFEDVRAFHQRFGFPAPDTRIPQTLSSEAWERRIRLILEELKELSTAQALRNLDDFADGCADLVYVVLGTAVEAGIPFDAIWRAVQDANMAKIGGETDAGGKLLKPEDWQAPDIRGILANGGMLVVLRCDSTFEGVRCLLDPGHPGDHCGTRKGNWK